MSADSPAEVQGAIQIPRRSPEATYAHDPSRSIPIDVSRPLPTVESYREELPMSNVREPDENPDAEVSEVFPPDEDVDSVGMPDHDFLGLSPGDADEETEPGAAPVPHGG